MNSFLKYLETRLSIDASDPALVRATSNMLARQMPLMYFILLFSSWALSFTLIGAAPDYLALYIPCALTVIGIYRASKWWNIHKKNYSIEELVCRLNSVNKASIYLSTFFTIWAISMFHYGDDFQQAHVAFYIAITVISCIFCLSYLPKAAKIITVIVNGTFVVFFFAQNIPFFSASALNVAVVCVGMLIVMDINNKNFRGMIKEQQKSLALIKENEQLANLDSLTGLPNRRAFYSVLERSLQDQDKSDLGLAAGIIDLDGFKPVNDLYGHQIGDKLLQAVGDRLQFSEEATSDYQLFRLGGDEFAFVVSNMPKQEDLLALGGQVCSALKAPFKIDELTVVVSGTVGIATRPGTVTTAAELLDRADHALYRGKRYNRGTCQLFSMDHATGFHREAEILQTLKAANLSEEIHPVFQPIIEVATNQVVAMEALARWHSPSLGWVSPNEFIPIAEQAGIIGKITCTMFKKALSEASNWPENMRLSFNLSAHDLSSDIVLLKLSSSMGKSDFQPKNIDFEITETALGEDLSQAQHMLDELRRLGCSVSLDDFGTGYSNLSRLHALPLKKVKIDRSFITGIVEGSTNFKIVKSLLVFAKDMQLKCIVEGVETVDELNIIKTLGADYVQGYYFSPPVESDKVEETISTIQAEHKVA